MAPPMILFDLDNTLYPPHADVMPEMNRRMNLFVADWFGVDVDTATEMRRGIPDIFGTTLQWLRVCHGLHDPESYIEAVHPADMENRVDPDPQLRDFIRSLPMDYVLFTNSPLEHAERTLRALGLADLFPRIWDLRRLGYRGKPDRRSYQRILGDLGLRPGDALLVDDNDVNLQAYRDMGGHVHSAKGLTSGEWIPGLVQRLGL